MDGVLVLLAKRNKTLESRMPVNGHVRFGGGLMEKYDINGTVTIELSEYEAIVLDNLLGRWQKLGFGFTLQLEHDAEWHALSVVLAKLEKQLAEPFMSDYMERVEEARKIVVDRWGSVQP
jgi:hypothetical protein